MWNREGLKRNAKDSLRLSYWPGLLASFLPSLFGEIYLFLGAPFQVGCNRFFLCARDKSTDVGDVGYSFTNGRYLKTIWVMFLMALKICLWTLLFIIPGIIKTYEYLMVPFILAENPELETKRIFELSRLMMQGEKFDSFILQLSFIGWMLLGLCACGFGILFVMPYYNATFAELYACLREKVIGAGLANTYELKGFQE